MLLQVTMKYICFHVSNLAADCIKKLIREIDQGLISKEKLEGLKNVKGEPLFYCIAANLIAVFREMQL